MILYSEYKSQFHKDVISNEIDSKIESDFKRVLRRRPAPGEVGAWRNSLTQMHLMLDGSTVPNDCMVAIEYMPPLSAKRIDFILTGRDRVGADSIVIVELKQWDSLETTDKQDIVKTWIGGGVREQAHPSYQAWSYAQLLHDFSVPVTDKPIHIFPCVYMHNLQSDTAIRHPQYSRVLADAPVFLRGEVNTLRQFVSEQLVEGDTNNIVEIIDRGEIKPSKKLADCVSNMLAGNHEFTMIDEQKVAYETIRAVALKRSKSKRVLIVKGGPGTGKSVVAINLLVNLLSSDLNVCYVSKNAAPRDVYKDKLAGGMQKSRIGQLFLSSGRFTDARRNSYDVLLVDEAHRLNAKSGIFRNLGENQIKEAVNAASCSVFFLDEDQRIALTDVGSEDEIRYWAKRYGADVTMLELASQFRCGGSNGYLSWLDNVLQIRDTANPTLDGIPYDFKIFDDPDTMHAAIASKNAVDGISRTVAGYCWKWISKKDPSATDINIGQFRKKWNLASGGNSWIIRADSLDEIGCIHTCQGLEMDYVGVIIGRDLVVRDGVCRTDASARSSGDRTISGYKALLKNDEVSTRQRLDQIIKNTYRVLMTRGMKGCYLYCDDPETREYFKLRITGAKDDEIY